jgi:hypothetical protein
VKSIKDDTMALVKHAVAIIAAIARELQLKYLDVNETNKCVNEAGLRELVV